ncbi:M24 family metallopeptidase [Streptacidiphilus sp. EB129]|uniref:M24 family metallopeptidase n=1 Tax=Streptacidiphilus sp. EB129 TaxID=3156262 RepID=UPI0035186185
MAEGYADRCDRLRERCGAAGLDAALVTSPPNIHWLTGADPTGAAALLLTRTEVRTGDPVVLAATFCAGLALGVEEHDLTVARHRAVTAAAAAREIRDLGRAVEQLRTVKDESEISLLRIAGEIADQALGELLESILVGRTERHLAMELERRMVDHGADGTAFPTRVGTGDHSGLADHHPDDRRVEDGDLLTVALGACYRGYRTAATRTFVVGLSPAEWQTELHRQVFDAQRAARESLAPGVPLDAADRAARRVLDAAGHAVDHPEEGAGRGVGLQIGEDPHLGPQELGKLDNRVPVTVGVGVTLPGRGGVRIEDTLVVRPFEDGGPELLTITTKELLAL